MMSAFEGCVAMSKSIREFMGMKRRPVGKVDELLDLIFEVIFDGFKKNFQLSINNYPTIYKFFDDFSIKYPKYDFVATWFLEKGLFCIKQMDTELSVIYDIEAFLEFEKVTLEIDVYEGTCNDFLFALTENLPAISGFITEFYESNLQRMPVSHEKTSIPISNHTIISTPSTFNLATIDDEWLAIQTTTSSAHKDAGLLIYT